MATYFVNTDAKSNDGRSYHDKWLERGIAVTSGRQKFRDKLARIEVGDAVLMYVNGVGIVAVGEMVDTGITDVVDRGAIVSPRETIEYHRRVAWKLDLRRNPIGPAAVRRACGQTPLQTVQRVAKGEAELNAVVAALG